MELFLSFNRIRSITDDVTLIAKALSSSNLIKVKYFFIKEITENLLLGWVMVYNLVFCTYQLMNCGHPSDVGPNLNVGPKPGPQYRALCGAVCALSIAMVL